MDWRSNSSLILPRFSSIPESIIIDASSLEGTTLSGIKTSESTGPVNQGNVADISTLKVFGIVFFML